MKHLLFAVALFTACKSSTTERAPVSTPPKPKAAEPAPVASATPVAVATPTPAPAPASGATFKPFENAQLGKQAWLPDGGKRGVVELIAIDDLSGRGKGTFKVTRRCGADAVKVVEAIDRQIVDREASHDPVACNGDHGTMTCWQGGNFEADTALEIVFRQDAAGAWYVGGVKNYRMGVTMDKQEAQFEKLLDGSCG